MADTPQSPGLLANILAVAGFIILIVIIVWGAYHLLRLTGSGISSLFSRFQNSAITISVPSGVQQSGKSFPLSWKYSPEENGTYAILYQCRNGFRFDATSPSGATAQVPCGNAFTVGNNTNVTLTPILSGTSTVDVPVSVIFMPTATSSTERPQGSATVRVAPGTTTPATTSSTGSGTGGKTTTSSSGGTSTGSSGSTGGGAADLSVRIIAVGVVDAYGNFVQRTPMNPSEITAVKFDIGNTGGRATGAWNFTVQLPTDPAYTYQSPTQASLAPGAHIENTLRFRPLAPMGGTISVLVDPQNIVSEGNERNNNASLWAQGGGWNYNQYPYQQPYVY